MAFELASHARLPLLADLGVEQQKRAQSSTAGVRSFVSPAAVAPSLRQRGIRHALPCAEAPRRQAELRRNAGYAFRP